MCKFLYWFGNMLEKQLVLSVNGNSDVQPPGLDVSGYFKRMGITNTSGILLEDGKSLILYPRLIFADDLTKIGMGYNSAILSYKAELTDRGIHVDEDSERVLFAAPKHPDSYGSRGVEDFRPIIVTVDGKKIVLGSLVHYDFYNMRTEIMENAGDLATPEGWQSLATPEGWQRDEIYIPNISAQEAIDLVPEGEYKDIWREHLEAVQEKIRNNGHFPVPDVLYQPLKDVTGLPTTKRKYIGGEERDCFGFPLRFPYNMQMIYVPVSNYKQILASKKFWQDVVENIYDHELLKRKEKSNRIGAAGQPLLVPLKGKYRDKFGLEEGLLYPFHDASMPRRYVLEAGLADPRNPEIIIAITKEPILVPTEPFEYEQSVIENNGCLFPMQHWDLGDVIGTLGGSSDTGTFYTELSHEEIFDKLVPVEPSDLEQILLAS